MKKKEDNNKGLSLIAAFLYTIILFVFLPVKFYLWIALGMIIFIVAIIYLPYSIMRIISCTILTIGILIFFLGILVISKQEFIRENKDIKREQIVEVNTFTITVENKLESHGDENKEKMLKPLFFHKQKGDWVNVLEIGSLKLVIEDSTFGRSLMIIGIYLLLLSPSLICLIIAPIKNIKL